jgi:hypothetical protein
MFFRSAGSAVGVAVFGAIVNATLGGSGVESGRVAPEALTTAVHHVFLGTTVLADALQPGRPARDDGEHPTTTVTPAAPSGSAEPEQQRALQPDRGDAITGMVSPMLAIAEPNARLRLICSRLRGRPGRRRASPAAAPAAR